MNVIEYLFYVLIRPQISIMGILYHKLSGLSTVLLNSCQKFISFPSMQLAYFTKNIVTQSIRDTTKSAPATQKLNACLYSQDDFHVHYSPMSNDPSRPSIAVLCSESAPPQSKRPCPRQKNSLSPLLQYPLCLTFLSFLAHRNS